MSTYDITLTDPLKSGFTIQPGAFDGPGGSRSHTSLRLYGRGALEWGEAVDENLVRLAETFAGSTPPLNPIQGQLWMRVRYYLRDTSAAQATAGWWFYNPSTKVWTRLNGTGVIAAGPTTNPTIGSYYYDSTTQSLYRWDTAYKQAGAAYLRREFTAINLNGSTPSSPPEFDLRVWDETGNAGAGQWAAPLTVTTAMADPVDPQRGELWYDTNTGRLKIWTGTAWAEILGPTTGGDTSAAGNINMQSFSIINLADGVIANGNKTAVNGNTVYQYVTNSIGGLGSIYLPLTGGTLTGNLTINTNTTVGGTTTTNNLTVTAAANLNGTTSISNLTIGTSIDANNHRVTGVSTPTAGTDAANKSYVDTAVSSAIGGLGGITGNNVTMIASGGAYKAGDICVNAGKIYIAVGSGTGLAPGGSWKQVFPAVYS